MQRREMLVAGFRSLARALPALLAAAGSLGTVLAKPAGVPASHGTTCFPPGSQGQPEKSAKPVFKEE